MDDAATVKTVEVKYKVTGVKELTEVEKLQARYVTTLKKLNQINRQVATDARTTAEAWKQQSQQLNQLNQTVTQISSNNDRFRETLLAQNQAQIQLTASVVQNTSAQQSNTASTQSNTQTRNASTTSVNANAESFLKNARTLAFWAIGTASVFRLVQKIRREFMEVVTALTENSDEYKRLTDAQERFKVSLVTLVSDEAGWLKFMDNIAAALEAFSDAMVKAKATIELFKAALNELSEQQQGVDTFRVTGGYVVPVFEDDAGVAQAGLDAYNASLAEAARLQSEWEIRLLKAGAVLDTVKDKIEAISGAEEARDKISEKFADAYKRRQEAIADLELERLRRLEDIIQKTQRAFEDLAIKGSRKREDIEIDFRRKLEDIEDRSGEERAKAESQLRLKLLAIELKYREQLIRIEENFSDQINDAIGKRDATAALKAIRTAARDRARAGRERDDARTLAFANFNEQINTQNRALERMREDAIKARQRALDDLRIDQERERQDILRNQEQELQDLALFLDRRMADIEADYAEQIEAARAFYRQSEIDYQTHLDTQYSTLLSHISRMGQLQLPYLPTILKDMPPQTSFAKGGATIFTRPTTASFAEQGPEAVFAMPLSPGAGSSGFSGKMSHNVSGLVEGVMAGFEGRLSAAVSDAVLGAMSEVLQ